VQVGGVWYRSVDGAVFRGFYGSKRPMRPLWGLGAPRGGGRFTPKNGPSSLYVAEDVDTANREGWQVTSGAPVKPAAGVTRAIYTVEVEINDVINLRDRWVRTLLGTSVAELRGPWRYRRDRKTPPTQRLGGMVATFRCVTGAASLNGYPNSRDAARPFSKPSSGRSP
jgi:RES domain-containing protein